MIYVICKKTGINSHDVVATRNSATEANRWINQNKYPDLYFKVKVRDTGSNQK